ncbi:MAG: BamA/TamA family outer membrane protein [Bacteroidetes bacterium]|nr:BamA/TamA family outer membrane protein [Bacteroidota bacterium]
MLRPLKILLSLHLLFTAFLYSQTIGSINLNGNKSFNKSDYFEWINIFPGQSMFEGLKDTLMKRISFNLNQRGYFDYKFDAISFDSAKTKNNVDITININEGVPTFFNKVNVENVSKADSNFVISSFNNLSGEIFNKFDLENTISEVLSYYENNGNPFAVVKIKSFNFYKDTLSKKNLTDIFLLIDAKKKSRINKIEIHGNKKTKNYVLIRELRIVSGQEYSQQNVNILPERLNKLGFFKPVKKPEYYINSKGEGVLSFDVQEIQTNNFDGIIGYIPGGRNDESGYVTGLVNINLRNLFGTGRAVSIKWQRLNRSSQLLDLNYLEPWLLGMPINLSTRIFQRKQDSSYVQRTFDISLQYLATDVLSMGVTLSLESVIPTDNGNSKFTVFNSTIVNTGLNLKLDTRNDLFSPTNGILFINSYSFRKKTINGPSQFISPTTATNINLQKLELSFDAYFSFVNRQVLAVKLHGGELRGPFFETSDLFRMGGFNSLRGYKEDQFLGSRIIWGNFEYRFLLTNRTYFFLFFDNGYFLRKEDVDRNIPKIEGYKTGYGLGINLETSLGILGVSFAFGEGDSFSDGKIHFGIINNF